MTNLDHTDTPASVDYATVYIAFELKGEVDARRSIARREEVEPLYDHRR